MLFLIWNGCTLGISSCCFSSLGFSPRKNNPNLGCDSGEKFGQGKLHVCSKTNH
jgi:hypothetical protein